MSQDEVADIYGVSRRTYQRWENGQTSVPSDHLFSILDQVFHLSIEQISGVFDAAI